MRNKSKEREGTGNSGVAISIQSPPVSHAVGRMLLAGIKDGFPSFSTNASRPPSAVTAHHEIPVQKLDPAQAEDEAYRLAGTRKCY